MPANPNKLSQFWQELKRRRVLRSLAIYAGTAFIILEASSIIFPLWNFPEWSINLVLWLLILGAFFNVIIAWIYDITPGGMRKTKPMEELTPEERIPDSRGWKVATYISVVVIVGLIVLNIVGGGKQLRAGDIQSLVILPFENFTGDDQLENMVFSMHSLLIGDMSRISGLRVIGKMSSKTFKDTDMSAKDIARELNVDAVLEPTIMCLGDSVCMQVRLVSTSGEEDLIWVGDFSEDKSQILNLYNRITRQIADEVKVELTPEEDHFLSISKTVDREAYDAYLKGLYFIDDGSKESLYKAMEYLNSAVEKDPNWAPLYSGLNMVWLTIAQQGYVTAEIAGPNIFANRNKALELDPNNPLIQVWYSAILIGLGDCETALIYGEKLVATSPGHLLGNSIVQEAAFPCNDYEKTFQATKNILPLEKEAIKEIEAIFDQQGFVATYMEITNQMEVVTQNGRISPIDMAVWYIYADRPVKAMDWLEKGFEMHDPVIPYIATGMFSLHTLYDNPRFIDILQKMNLPLPED